MNLTIQKLRRADAPPLNLRFLNLTVLIKSADAEA